MTTEARFEQTPAGRVRSTPGWFAVNLRDAAWVHNDKFGDVCQFEGAAKFERLGVNVHVLQPGQPACQYHRENQEECFLVLHGECLVVVEGGERALSQWDFFHSPAGTNHVFVGAGDGPCAILMMGARTGDPQLCYPVDATATAHGASVEEETGDPRVAYANAGSREPTPAPAPFAGGD